MNFPFDDAPDTAAIVCCHVLEKNKPILYVSHDADDGMWQFLCGKAHKTHEARIVSLMQAFTIDNSVGMLHDMPYGCCAVRKNKKADWNARACSCKE